MIGLIEFLKASGVVFNAESCKIHLACWNGYDHPIDVYYAGKFEEWQQWQTRRNFSCEHVIGLIDLGLSHWLFAGVYQVLGEQPHPQKQEHFLYSTRLLDGQDDLVGRVVVHHERTRQSYIWYKPDTVKLPIAEIRSKRMSIGEFPGYNSVLIGYPKLRVIIEQRIDSWYGALSNIKGVYLITDTSTGKLYVGSATGGEGIWQRWSNYADNGHGGNVELKQLLEEKGAEHVKNFQYSILEIADTHASDNDILAREYFWMDVLKTPYFGLNGSKKKAVQ